LEVPQYPGGRLIRTQTKMRKIIRPVALFYESMDEAEKFKKGVPPAFRKKTTLRIFSIKRAVILRIKRLFYT
ncbi:hypothetical protein P4H55_29330, partial [Bacillus cereus]|nr:hypothetical protein [Bacillus cereus]